MKIAIYGGTFDPVHCGHLEAARKAADACALDRVLFIPAGYPPHRPHSPGADYDHRYKMVEIACRQDARFVASRLEAPSKDSKRHYSIDTIGRLRQDLAPQDQLFFILGSDAFADFTSWHRWRDVAELVEFIVVSRPGAKLPEEAPEGCKIHLLPSVNVPVSSTEIRERLSSGESAGDMLPPDVGDYIRRHGLYQDRTVRSVHQS